MHKQRLEEIIKKIVAGNATAEEIEEISGTIQEEKDSVEDIHAMLTHPADQQFHDDQKKWDFISAKI